MNKRVPIRYLPKTLSLRDKKKQVNMLNKSRRLYKTGQYYTRSKLPSYHNKTSKHILNARRIYNIEHVVPSRALSRATGCSIKALQKIVEKGEGAYYSSGSRPNQTAHSWGFARLASSITAGKSAAVDYNILEKGCDHTKRAYKLAQKSRRKYKYGHSSAYKTSV